MREPLPRLLAPTIVLAGLLSACSGGRELICERSTAYLEARSINQLRIPDDLSVPDETESLRIPETLPPADPDLEPPGGCLDASPAFVESE